MSSALASSRQEMTAFRSLDLVLRLGTIAPATARSCAPLDFAGVGRVQVLIGSARTRGSGSCYFEILVGEDASSDGTRDVCIAYAKKYPKKIKLFLHSRENNIRVYGKPTAKFNSAYNSYNAKGKYIAICEGDDFWTDPLKLQKQVDFWKLIVITE